MSEQQLVSAYADDESNTIVTVSAAQAKADGLTVLKSDPAVGKNGLPRGPRVGNRTSVKKTANTTTENGGAAASKPEEASK